MLKIVSKTSNIQCLMKLLLFVVLVNSLFITGCSESNEVQVHKSGSLDMGFGQDGKLIIENDSTESLIQPLGVDTESRMLIANLSPLKVPQLMRYLSDGSLDGSFGKDELTETHMTEIDSISDMAIDKQGRIIIAGTILKSDAHEIFLIRYQADGDLDKSFGTNGVVTTYIEQGDKRAFGIALNSEGNIFVVGAHYISSRESNLIVLSYDVNGDLNTSFSSDGLIIEDFEYSDVALDVIVDDSDKIVITGISEDETLKTKSFIVRYHWDGSRDDSFGLEGNVFTNTEAPIVIQNIYIDDQGRLLVSGNSWIEANSIFVTLRYTQGGVLDKTFGVDGIVRTDFAKRDVLSTGQSGTNLLDANRQAFIEDLVTDKQGRIIVVGSSRGEYIENFNFTVVRYTPNGDLDQSFDEDGKVFTFVDGMANDVVIDSKGRILVAGSASEIDSYGVGIARYWP